MKHRSTFMLAMPMIVLLSLPLVALIWSTPTDWTVGTGHPFFLPALKLTLWTTTISVGLIILLGTPLAWWLAQGDSRTRRLAALLVDTPIVLPPAVVGIALLESFGRSGLLSVPLQFFGLQIPFTSLAVIIAQMVVAAPFYIHSATAGFRSIHDDLNAVAMTLGATPWLAFVKVSLPTARPSILSGIGLAWGRAIGEFGATLIFAGNLSGVTQTMPLAIYATLDENVHTAIALSLVLTAIALFLLLLLRARPHTAWGRQKS